MRHNEPTFRLDSNDQGLSALLLGLARDVRRVVHDGPADPDETIRLGERLTRLRDVAPGPHDTPLGRWFESLQRELDSAACESSVR